ncbi:hypothetical protein [Caulobacter phage Cr30]|uniref:hypothetical protein n=1 Tax=Caulobacter phage Cr30 TaxID=1357714 RepID=UPI0004A9B5C7|nr:hypothetical protein OZ74_gp283 [Caulobacter phage Cr30]AGS81060.1 hypothetical protein [Caulobacter phage Cr30]
MPFVLKDNETGKYWACAKTYGSWKLVDDLDKARIYGRRCDVSNSITYSQTPDNVEIVEVKLVEV